MPKSKRPAPRKSSPQHAESSSHAADAKDNSLTFQLCDLAIDLVEREDAATMSAALRQKDIDFHKLVKKCLYQKKDAVLYEALERAQDADSDAWTFLKDSIEEAAATIVQRRDDGEIEINAFVIPMFVHTRGGLQPAHCFQDDKAFLQLTESFQAAQLESAAAKVVLVSHAYHLEEIDRITYCHLNEMVRDALTAMSDKKIVATPAIDRSIAGWPENLFETEDQAVELRFLLGFALKPASDRFYRVPDEEAAADEYFAQRAQRFQQWTGQALPLVKRCLVNAGTEIDVNFLYQDLFFGAKENGIAEYYMLQMMSELSADLDEHGAQPQDTSAIIGPVEVGGQMLLRVNLYARDGGALLASSDKPLDVARELEVEVADTLDALQTIGVSALSLALQFDAEGQPREVRPYEQ